ncbi:MAG: hypothetical protein L0Z62_19995, partial [Gemmataceae bacterium]|nr:hypothetical protein [Gemmataceae bacterium]
SPQGRGEQHSCPSPTAGGGAEVTGLLLPSPLEGEGPGVRGTHKEPTAIPAVRAQPAEPPPDKQPDHVLSDLPVIPPVQFEIVHPQFEPAKTTEPRTPRLAVTPSSFDEMGRLLVGLGRGYRYTLLTQPELNSPARLSQFDVIFLTCANSSWQDLRQNRTLRQYVERGGTLYASDLRLDALAGAFPDYIDRSQLGRSGDEQTVPARVVNPGLREVLGEAVKLRFNASRWKPAAFLPDKVTTYLEGEYRLLGGVKVQGPLLVKFAHGKGAVIFTAFHNSAQNSELERKLLEYLVFTAVTVQVESNMRKHMLASGFVPQDTARLAVTAGQTTPAHTYANPTVGPMQFALGFESKGVKVRLTLTGPRGQQVEHEDSKSFVVQIASASAGPWRWAVTADRAPFPNYPLTLTVGKPAVGEDGP